MQYLQICNDCYTVAIASQIDPFLQPSSRLSANEPQIMSRDTIVIITRSKKRCAFLRQRFERDGRESRMRVVTVAELLQGIEDDDVWVFLLDRGISDDDAAKVFSHLEVVAPHIPVVPSRQDVSGSEI